MTQLEGTKIHPCDHIASAPIFLFGQEYAELFICSEDIPISEYDLLILDRTATALAQHLLREMYVEEKSVSRSLSGFTAGLRVNIHSKALVNILP